MRSLFKRLLAASLLAGSMVSASAVSYSGITIFGDSLSDTGNIFAATGGALPTAPYFAGRFSEGAVWTDYLAGSLGYTATASLMGGQNYAFGGARTGSDTNPPGLLAQTAGLWAPTVAGAADPDRLYVLVGGGNDMRDARTAFQGNTVADEAGRQAAAELAAFQLTQSLGVLAANGAKTVLIGNLPDLGRTPEAVALGLVAPSTDATNRFNDSAADRAGRGCELRAGHALRRSGGRGQQRVRRCHRQRRCHLRHHQRQHALRHLPGQRGHRLLEVGLLRRTAPDDACAPAVCRCGTAGCAGAGARARNLRAAGAGSGGGGLARPPARGLRPSSDSGRRVLRRPAPPS